jgi:hypothetical protein
MNEYFMTQSEDYKSYVRDNKLKELGIWSGVVLRKMEIKLLKNKLW